MSHGDAFFFSPDLGYLVIRGDSVYTDRGEILLRDAKMRIAPIHSEGHQNYADWSEDQRAAVREKYAQRRRALERNKRLFDREELVDKARAKLTIEEFEAVYNEGFESGRDYGPGFISGIRGS